MTLKKKFEEFVAVRAPGPHPAFSVFDLIRALERLSSGPVGRGKLSRELDIGEGSVRTLIRRLREAQIIAVAKEGCVLTEKGKELWKLFKSFFPRKTELKKNELAPATFNVAILAKNLGERVKTGIKQRDAAITEGAKWATTLIFKSGKLLIPSVSKNVEEEYPETFRQIIETLRPEEGDAIVVAGADTLKEAEHGALAAVWTLLENSC